LGTGDIEDRQHPQHIKHIQRIVKIGCGNNHSLIINNCGDVYTFGQADQGQVLYFYLLMI